VPRYTHGTQRKGSAHSHALHASLRAAHSHALHASLRAPDLDQIRGYLICTGRLRDSIHGHTKHSLSTTSSHRRESSAFWQDDSFLPHLTLGIVHRSATHSTAGFPMRHLTFHGTSVEMLSFHESTHSNMDLADTVVYLAFNLYSTVHSRGARHAGSQCSLQ